MGGGKRVNILNMRQTWGKKLIFIYAVDKSVFKIIFYHNHFENIFAQETPVHVDVNSTCEPLQQNSCTEARAPKAMQTKP